ncbi:protein-associating with the carboxyl-terminal domain of ezrin [Cylas formicarius]|uniref:protein-associating with the carboxyl-terminal domain of ezrin n=1 Tax=Cylas formicarius TaxID=197179 RepID=UPI00295883FF|nr:protein-associating with the carboxyl-terminal domain of ezrin [Cylas formicarius]
MGNDQSDQRGVEVTGKPIQTTNFWSHHVGVLPVDAANLSIFIGDSIVPEACWTDDSPLKRNGKNLMIYRHPCILKYVSSWQRMSKFYLATEEAAPLAQSLPSLTQLEICVGLHSVLKALCFLHRQANVSHNNVCVASVYVAKDRTWKLGGMEYACRYKELTSDYLVKTQSSRYGKARDANEVKYVGGCKGREDFIDAYAFATLATELLSSKVEGTTAALDSFKDLCKAVLHTADLADRPGLHAIIGHEFFKNKFLAIHSFLVELPLKSETEKNEFFVALAEELKRFDEEVVARHLGGLLLSRMVFLDKTAEKHLLPRVLRIADGLFSKAVFVEYIAQKILRIMTVRDLQIRSVLLTYFSGFVDAFSEAELETRVLPELLVGIKDTNGELVAATLRALADLVPVLGADVVIGGQRARLFNDGRPVTRKGSKPVDTQQVEVQIEENQPSLSNSIVSTQMALQERSRPDGEEGESSTEETFDDEDLGNWEEWTNAEDEEGGTRCHAQPPKKLPDITKLDIKNQEGSGLGGEEVDFFQDMEPVIETKGKFVVDHVTEGGYVSKLRVTADDGNEDGWGNDEWT